MAKKMWSHYDAVVELERAVADPNFNPKGYLVSLHERCLSDSDLRRFRREREDGTKQKGISRDARGYYGRLLKVIDLWHRALLCVAEREVSLYGARETCKRHGMKYSKHDEDDRTFLSESLFEIYEEKLGDGFLFG